MSKRKVGETKQTQEIDKTLEALTSRERNLFRQQIRDANKQVELLEARIERMQKSKWKIPVTKKEKHKGETFCRLIVSDTHGSVANPVAVNAMLDDIEVLSPKEVIWLGDHLECGGFLAQHHVLGYVAQTEYTFEQDVHAANVLLDQVQAATARATHHYLEGNHERRIERWCVTQALRNKADADFLFRHFSAESQLHLNTRKFNYYRQGQFYMGLTVPSVIRLGQCYFTHGSTNAKQAATIMLAKYGSNVVFGHNHRSDEASRSTVKQGTIKGWCPGCLCNLQPLWKHSDPSEWNHGYAVQLVNKSNGAFLHVNVPITNGKSYLIPFITE